MVKKQKKPSRRPFGRPKDGPGPQETFVGEFQVEQAQTPPPVGGSQHTIRLSPPAQAQAQYEFGLVPSSSVHRSNSTPERGRKGRKDGASSVRHTEMSPDDDMSTAGPNSWPRDVHLPASTHALPDPLLQPMSQVAYRGSDRQAPVTPGFGRGQYPTPGLTPSTLYDTPSTSSLPLLSPSSFSHRHRTYEPPELSPTDPLYHWRQYSSVPHTPLSMRGGSIPPSVQSESSPYLDSLFDFSPTFGPIVGPVDVPDLPPLSPDPVPEGGDLFWGHEGSGAHAPGAETAPANNDPMLLGSAQYPSSSVAVPGQQLEQFPELGSYGLPQETVASSGPAICWPQIDITYLQDMSQNYSEPYFGPPGSSHGYSAPPDGAPGPGPGPSR
ncbi:hypothetical protein L226DRAFT_524186 [Lentinus tigrinus ALCF2SS1-7]|uniref:uncharacterized protein n=1 Tax=Lentinus tigrinus ALCF2SS1-7 TaxID=1328758 RepID=UPI001165C972|nr:hypothetical protein L226DRAFT_524186 [Lentinus tigrinus ALCF2SS1-7]